ncbi:hypothetical protein LRP49_24945, partial [Enterovibrio sp. ZSDZ35]
QSKRPSVRMAFLRIWDLETSQVKTLILDGLFACMQDGVLARGRPPRSRGTPVRSIAALVPKARGACALKRAFSTHMWSRTSLGFK